VKASETADSLEPIPFNRPFVTGDEAALISAAISERRLSGDGRFTAEASELLRNITGAQRAFLTTSCTHALEMAALLLEVGPGDEVIMPSFTFVSTANAFVLRGARPVFVDIRSDTLNIDERLVEQAVTSRTKAIVVVHYAGIACEMDVISDVALRHGLAVVEDNAHGLGAQYRGRQLGTIGAFATLSFHETKNVHCGEGGALLINEVAYVERAEVLREKGTNRSRFFRGEVDKYTWIDQGSSYLPSEVLAAFLTAQLRTFDLIQQRRMHVWTRYQDELTALAVGNNWKLPTVPPHVRHPAHLFWLEVRDLEQRQRLLAHLRTAGIHAVFHYVPLHTSPMGRQFGDVELPNTVSTSDRLIRLPLYPDLSNGDVDRVVASLMAFQP
jgi:dTDP-4-amino-4,6-dideoxygalactose transaminase